MHFTTTFFAVLTQEGERLWHLHCKGEGNEFINEYDWSAKNWKFMADLPEELDIRPSITVFGGGHMLFLVGSEYKKGRSMPRQSWIMKDLRTKREWEEVFIPFGFNTFSISPVPLRIQYVQY